MLTSSMAPWTYGGIHQCSDDDGEAVLAGFGSLVPSADPPTVPPTASCSQAAPTAGGATRGGHLHPASMQEEAEQQALTWAAEWLCDASMIFLGRQTLGALCLL